MEGAASWPPACPAGLVESPNPPGEGSPEEHRTMPVVQLKNLFQKGGEEILKPPSGKDHLAPKGNLQKPCMLPVRLVPPSSHAARSEELSPEQVQTRVKDGLQVGLSAILPSTSPHARRWQLPDMDSRSPSLRRGPKPLKVSEEADSTASVPLEAAEHQWLVKATTGQWSQQLHGLLLIDLNLANKRDFMSGFTVLHWAAKSGNCTTLRKVIEMAEKEGISVDVNAKSYGGYTPLHIAALHGQEEVIVQLVKVYNAKVSLRDNSGKKPFQYLKEGSSFAVRHLLNDPSLHTITGQNPSIKKNGKVAASILTSTSTVLGLLSDDIAFYELTKGLKKPAPINKLLNIATAPRRKLKSRRTFSSSSSSSLYEALQEEQDESASKHRPVSELFFGHLIH